MSNYADIRKTTINAKTAYFKETKRQKVGIQQGLISLFRELCMQCANNQISKDFFPTTEDITFAVEKSGRKQVDVRGELNRQSKSDMHSYKYGAVNMF